MMSASWNRASLVRHFALAVLAALPLMAQTPVITSVTPSVSGNLQTVTLRGSNLLLSSDAPGSVVVRFNTVGAGSYAGTVIAEASSPTTLIARVPVNPAIEGYIAFSSVTVVKGNLLSNAFPFTSSAALVPPVLRAAYILTGSSCSGHAGSTPLTQAFPGQWVVMAADGVDVYGGTFTFTSPAGTFTSDSYCVFTDPNLGIAYGVQVPANAGSSGTLQVRVSAYTLAGYTPNSNAISLNLTAAPPPPVITRVQPASVSSEQIIAIFGNNLMIPGGSDPVVTFFAYSESSIVGTLIPGASTANVVYVKLPTAYLLGSGIVEFSLGNENGIASSQVNVTATAGTPAILNVYGFSSPPNPNNLCSGTLNPTPLTQIAPGQAIAISAAGISQANNTVRFSTLSGSTTVASPCSITNSTAGIAAVVVVPATLLACTTDISIQTMVEQTDPAGPSLTSPYSATVAKILLSVSPTAISLSSSLNPSQYGQVVPFTALVASQLGCTVPTGVVTFLDGGSTVVGSASVNANGVAATGISGLAPGLHPITARYSGDGRNLPSTSGPVQQVVQGSLLTLSGSCPGRVPVGVLLRLPLDASGGTGLYSYSYSGPSWLSLVPGVVSGSMALQGTPTSTGTFPFSVTVTDGSGSAPAVFRCSLIVDPTLTMTGACPAPQAAAGSPYSLPVTIAGGSGQYEFFLNGPAWLTLSASTGSAVNGTYQLYVRGTPPATGSFPISVQVRDVLGQGYLFSNCSVEVVSPTLTVTSGCPATPAVIGTPYSFMMSATGGSAPYAWSITGGALPAGLGLSGNTIAGTPQGPAGTSRFSMRVTSGPATGQIDCALAVEAPLPPPLTLTAACPLQPVVSGTGVSLSYTAAGGTPPYRFQFQPPVQPWLTLSSAGSVATATGTAPLSGTYPVGVGVADSEGKIASASCDVPVIKPTCPPLELRTASGCPASPVLAGVPYGLDVSAAGGKAPYTWSLSGPAWLALQETGASSARVGGLPATGSSNYTVSLRDACESPEATLTCGLTAAAVPVPQVAFNPSTITDPLQQVRVELRLGSPSPAPIDAELVLTFTASATGVTDNPRVQFLDPNATDNGRRLKVTLPAGAVSVLVPVQPDTIAGQIHVEIASYKSGTTALLQPPYPSVDLTVPRLAPVITNMTLENATASGFDIVISGYSSPRDMTTAAVTFAAKPGKSIDEPSTVTVSLSDLFRNYYASAASRTGGSTFTGLRLPVQIQGAQDAIGSVSVVLSNSVGASKAEVRTR